MRRAGPVLRRGPGDLPDRDRGAVGDRGIGLIFYGFAWLLLPADGEDQNEARKLLSGRVDGAALVALLLALIGCGLFLSMLHNRGMLSFAALLTVAVVGFAVWTQSRRTADPETRPPRPAHRPPLRDPPTPAGSARRRRR